MKYFERDGKYNFVDANNVFVGFDSESQCSETFGWFISETQPNEIDLNFTPLKSYDGFIFDPTFFYSGNDGDADFVTFRLKNGDKVLYLSLYNKQNGYYSHQFTAEMNGKVFQIGSL